MRHIPRETLLDILDEEDSEVLLLNEISGTSRWAVHHRMVFRYAGKIYQAFYRRGATEQQDEQPFEHEAIVGCTEVREVPKTIMTYIPFNEEPTPVASAPALSKREEATEVPCG